MAIVDIQLKPLFARGMAPSMCSVKQLARPPRLSVKLNHIYMMHLFVLRLLIIDTVVI